MYSLMYGVFSWSNNTSVCDPKYAQKQLLTPVLYIESVLRVYLGLCTLCSYTIIPGIYYLERDTRPELDVNLDIAGYYLTSKTYSNEHIFIRHKLIKS